MSRTAPVQTTFNGGEISQLIAARADVAKYGNACEILENFIPAIQGPAIARPGFRFLGEVKTSTKRTWLVPFIFSETDAYSLEFGDLYIRFWVNHAQEVTSGVAAYNNATAYVMADLVTQGGVTYYCKAATTGNAPPNVTYWYPLTTVGAGPAAYYEIPSPYSAAELTNADGTFALSFAQSLDEVRIAHPAHPPQLLSRLATARWTIAPLVFNPPPFAKLNATTTTIVASATTGAVSLVASAATFAATDVGRWLYLAEKDVRTIQAWQTAVAITSGTVMRSAGNNYKALNSATTGNVKPTHVEGATYDGSGLDGSGNPQGVLWQFEDSGYGYVQITAVADATHASGVVQLQLPDDAVGANPTTRWALQAWGPATGYPSCVTFFRDRAVWAWDETLAWSVSSDYDNFAYEIDGQITADAGFQRTLSSPRSNTIRWLSSGVVLLVGTVGDEWAITEASTASPFGPDNAKAAVQTVHGSASVTPIQIADETLFVQKAGRKVRALKFDFLEEQGTAQDMTAFAPHIGAPRIQGLVYQQEPWSTGWAWRSDGVALSCTFSREQQVLAWARHPLAGGIVECMAVIPAPDGSRDDLWAIVRYTIAGITKRYVMVLGVEDDETGSVDQVDWCYSDALTTYSGAPATVITGLDYLEGQEVWVLRDGAAHPNRTVSGGQIQLDRAGSKVQIGLPCEATLFTTAMEPGSAFGSSMGNTKRAHQVVVRVLRTLGAKVGPDASHLEDLQQRAKTVPLGSAPGPFTGDELVDFDADYSTRLQVMVKKTTPRPVTVVAIGPKATVAER